LFRIDISDNSIFFHVTTNRVSYDVYIY